VPFRNQEFKFCIKSSQPELDAGRGFEESFEESERLFSCSIFTYSAGSAFVKLGRWSEYRNRR